MTIKKVQWILNHLKLSVKNNNKLKIDSHIKLIIKIINNIWF